MSATEPRYAVFGHPVAHSRSPAIQRAFAAEFGVAIDYRTIDAAPADFGRTVHDFFATGGAGANVTVPHKRAAAGLADECSAAVARAGVANVLTRLPDGRLRADNTDGSGLVRDLTVRRGCVLRDARILLLGAGGAAHGIAGPLLDAEPRELVIANRSAARATALADTCGPLAHAVDWSELGQLGAFDLVLNATAAGLMGAALELPPNVAGAATLACDLAYGAAAQPFLAWAAATGARAFDGFGMLVETAADSYALWRGARPQTDAVFAALVP